jgi:hypothetical protein
MRATACPFCGVVTDMPHDTQEACIEALQAEIARVRGILDNSVPLSAPLPTEDKGTDQE